VREGSIIPLRPPPLDRPALMVATPRRSGDLGTLPSRGRQFEHRCPVTECFRQPNPARRPFGPRSAMTREGHKHRRYVTPEPLTYRHFSDARAP